MPPLVDAAPLPVALVGAGRMGANHARVLADSHRARLAVVIDADIERARALAEPAGALASTDIADVSRAGVAIISASTEVHVPLARAVMAQGTPLLVEKPLATDLAGARALVAESARLGVPLTCGFVERFNPVLRTALTTLDSEPVHVLAVRHSPRNGPCTTSVVHDMVIHDLDVACRLAGGSPVASVRAVQVTAPGRPSADLADATAQFANRFVATVSGSRLGHRKVRSYTITTETAVVELDLIRQDITLYRHLRHEALNGDGHGYRFETAVDIPFVRRPGEPLAPQLDHLCDLVDGTVDADVERASLLPAHELAALVDAASVEVAQIGAAA